MSINPLLKTVGTIVTISDGKDVLPFYSARGGIQTMGVIGAAKVQRRTVNFQLVNLALSRARKYTSTLSANDIRPPSRDDVWPGKVVTVGCAYLLCYPTVGGVPSRDVVSGSQKVEGNFTFYRPVLTMMIGEPQGKFDEWKAGYDWSLPMEEV